MNDNLLERQDKSEFAITPVSKLRLKTKSQLVNEVNRLQTVLAKLYTIAESAEPVNRDWILKLHPLVRIRKHLRSIAFNNLQ